MRLIDADIFESVLDFADSDVCEESPDGDCDFGFSRENIRELLRDIPAVEAVPVVRCGECEYHYWEQEPCHGKSVHYCKLPHMRGVEVFKEFFCYYGKRKEGAD